MPEPRYEHCTSCGEPTGRAGRLDDSIFAGHSRVDIGPLCEECRDDLLLWAREYEAPAVAPFIRFRVVPQSYCVEHRMLYFKDLNQAITRAKSLAKQDGPTSPRTIRVEGNQSEHGGEWKLLETYRHFRNLDR